MYRLAVFDLDGTLLDTLHGIVASFNAALAEFGLPARSPAEYRALLGYGSPHLARSLLPPGADERTVRDLVARYLHHYATLGSVGVEPYPGIPECLRALQAQGVALAVLSNKPHPLVAPQTARFFPGLFCAVRGLREEVPAKPHPSALFALLDEFSVPAAACVYVGDMAVDMELARRAQVRGIAVAWGYGGSADRTASELAAVPERAAVHTAEALTRLILQR